MVEEDTHIHISIAVRGGAGERGGEGGRGGGRERGRRKRVERIKSNQGRKREKEKR